MKNILVLSAGKRVVLVQIFQQTLKALGLRACVYTTDLAPHMAPACIISDKSFVVPRCTADNYIERLLEICKTNDVGLIIPTIDTELLLLSSNRDKFTACGAEVVVSDFAFVSICRDKRLTSTFLTELGVPMPRLIDKRAPSFPMFAKPYNGSLSTNIHVIHSSSELTEQILNDETLIFMEYVDKAQYKEFTVDMYYGRDNRVKGIVPRERIAIRAGEINKGITRKNYLVDFLKQRMSYLSGVRGCICLQLFYRENDNDIKGIEINPRFGGGYPLSYYAKANFADYLIKEYLLGECISYSEDWLDKTLMLRYDNEVIVYDKA